MKTTIEMTMATTATSTLRHCMRVWERDALAAVAAGRNDAAVWGWIELANAAGAELGRRAAEAAAIAF